MHIYIYAYIYIRYTHKHIHIYIYTHDIHTNIYICICLCVYRLNFYSFDNFLEERNKILNISSFFRDVTPCWLLDIS